MNKIAGKIRQGSALLVAVLVMAILMTITLGLSTLVVSQIRQTGDVVAAGKAYYAAEAGVENALLDLHEHLPGYQTENLSPDGWVASASDDTNLVYRYRIRNQGNSYPYFDADKPIFLSPGIGSTRDFVLKNDPEATYNVLPLNDTVTIPLFVDCGDGTYRDVKDFLLQYYVNYNLSDTYKGYSMSDFDILRWKLFGQPAGVVLPDQTGRTDAISDFYPVGSNTSVTNPTCIGSDQDLTFLGNADSGRCTVLMTEDVNLPDDVGNFSTLSPDLITTFQNAWSGARECYLSDVGSISIGNPTDTEGTVQKNCTMTNFMQSHTRNYLTITNVVNPQIVGITNPSAEEQAAAANIYYRLLAKADPSATGSCPGQTAEDVMVREAADISADGYANDKTVTQSIDAQLKLNSFLPVFNFSLFRTDVTKTNPEDQVQTNPLAPMI